VLLSRRLKINGNFLSGLKSFKMRSEAENLNDFESRPKKEISDYFSPTTYIQREKETDSEFQIKK
jgi:hypothetical protein